MGKFWLFLLLILSPSLGVSEVGYKDLKIGMSWNSAEKICGEISYYLCYKYSSRPFPKVEVYGKAISEVDLIVVEVGTYEQHFEKLKAALSKKYGLPDYHFSEEDLELYNARVVKYLIVMFAQGTVMISINPMEDAHIVTVGYHTKKDGKRHLQEQLKGSSNTDDF